VNQEHLILGNLAWFYFCGAFFGREEIDDVEFIEHLLADAVDAPHALDYPHRIPGDIIVDHHAGTVEVETFWKPIRGKHNVEIIVLVVIGSIKILINLVNYTGRKVAAYS